MKVAGAGATTGGTLSLDMPGEHSHHSPGPVRRGPPEGGRGRDGILPSRLQLREE